jgi:hypothetical protein
MRNHCFDLRPRLQTSYGRFLIREPILPEQLPPTASRLLVLRRFTRQPRHGAQFVEVFRDEDVFVTEADQRSRV